MEVQQDQNKQVYEDRIKWLKRNLYYSELEIARLYKEREVSEQEILGLKSQLASSGKKIKYLEKLAESRLLFIEYQDGQISGELSGLHEEIINLKLRIKELVAKKNIIKELNSQKQKDMAQPRNNNPLDRILADRQALTDALAGIQLYFDRRAIPVPANVVNRFTEATIALNAIIQHVNDARRQREHLERMHVEALLDEVNERRVWWLRTQRAERHNHVLRQEKIGYRWIVKRREHQLTQCRNNRGLLEYNRD